jgi:hypothetical protein
MSGLDSDRERMLANQLTDSLHEQEILRNERFLMSQRLEQMQREVMEQKELVNKLASRQGGSLDETFVPGNFSFTQTTGIIQLMKMAPHNRFRGLSRQPGSADAGPKYLPWAKQISSMFDTYNINLDDIDKTPCQFPADHSRALYQFLIQCCSDTALDTINVVAKNDGKAAWLTLRGKYDVRTEANTQAAMLDILFHADWSSSDTADSHQDRMTSKINRLLTAGGFTSTNDIKFDRVMHAVVMNALPERMHDAKQLILGLDKLPTQDNVYDRLRAHEIHNPVPRQVSSANAAQITSGCTYCGKRGHREEVCFKKQADAGIKTTPP